MKGINRKQLRCLIAAIILVFVYGLANNTVSFYLIPITESFRIGRAQYNLVNTCVFITSTLIGPFFGKLIQKYNPRIIIGCGAVAGALCMYGFSISTSITPFYVIGAILGLFQSGCTFGCATYSLIIAFGNKSGTPIGISTAATGLCSMIFGAFLPAFIETNGWPAGYRLQAVLWFILSVAALLIIGNPKNAMDPGSESSGSQTGENREIKGATVSQALRSPKLWLFLLALVLMDICLMFLQHMYAYGIERGLTPVQAGQLFSIYSFAAILMKICLGWLYQKIGPVRATLAAYVSFAVGITIMSFGGFVVMAIGTIPLALGMALALTGTPLQARALFGEKNFASINGIATMGASLGTLAGSPLWGLVFDMTGSYTLAIRIAPIIMISVGLMLAALIRKQSDWNIPETA